MAAGVRYNLKHLGDNFYETVQKTADAAELCSKGVFIVYDMKSLSCKRHQISREIGKRVTQLIKDGVAHVTSDAVLAGLIAILNSVENDLRLFEQKKIELRNQFKEIIKKRECATN